MRIEPGKKYKTRNGKEVRVDGKIGHHYKGVVGNETIWYTGKGKFERYHYSKPHRLDITEPIEEQTND